MFIKWPEIFPEDCPPVDCCLPGKRVVFRLIKGMVILESDFLPHILENPDTKYSQAYKCRACGLSFFTELESAKRTIQTSPVIRKSNKIARGTLTDECGVLKNTPSTNHSGHVTLWVAPGYNLVPLFSLIEMRE